MAARISLEGQKFGRLTVVRKSASLTQPNGQKRARYLCVCDCGAPDAILEVSASNLRTGNSASCGCSRSAAKKHGHAARGARTREHHSWAGMKQRCYDSNHRYYANYGGRGIRVCAEWVNSFSQFLADMGPRPAGCTLDRVDNNGAYSKGNCRWATAAQQRANQRSAA